MTRDLDVSVASHVSVLSIFHVMQFHKHSISDYAQYISCRHYQWSIYAV